MSENIARIITIIALYIFVIKIKFVLKIRRFDFFIAVVVSYYIKIKSDTCAILCFFYYFVSLFLFADNLNIYTFAALFIIFIKACQEVFKSEFLKNIICRRGIKVFRLKLFELCSRIGIRFYFCKLL